jgi:hypothetical protein
MIEVQITNPGGTAFTMDVNCDAPTRPVDAHRYAEFSFTTNRYSPIAQYAWVKAAERGHVLFRGYVFSFNTKGNKLQVKCRGEEELLMHRFSPRMGYGQAENTYLDELFSDLAPTQVLNSHSNKGVTGMLFLANSSMPPGAWWLNSARQKNAWASTATYFAGDIVTYSGYTYESLTSYGNINNVPSSIGVDSAYWRKITNWWPYTPYPVSTASGTWPSIACGWKLPGWGTNSRLGATPTMYLEGDAMTQYATYASFATAPASAEAKFFMDSTDLYFNLDPQHFGAGWRLALTAYNAFDTHVRTGTINKSTTQILGNVQMDFQRCSDVIINFATYFGLTPHYRYGSDYTYLDLIDES